MAKSHAGLVCLVCLALRVDDSFKFVRTLFSRHLFFLCRSVVRNKLNYPPRNWQKLTRLDADVSQDTSTQQEAEARVEGTEQEVDTRVNCGTTRGALNDKRKPCEPVAATLALIYAISNVLRLPNRTRSRRARVPIVALVLVLMDDAV